MSKKFRDLFLVLTFKIAAFVGVLASISFIPLIPSSIPAHYPNSISYALSRWDGAIYIDICANDYSNTRSEYPENLMKYAFYPGLPLQICVSKLFYRFLPVIFNYFHFAVAITFLNFFFLYTGLSFFMRHRYKDINLAKYILWTYLVFPFSFFFHVVYTEALFLGVMFWSLYFLENKQVWKSNLFGLVLGVVRVSALPLAVLNWIRFSMDYWKNYSHTPSKADRISKIKYALNYLFKSAGFAFFGFGTLSLFTYFYYKYQNFWMFFRSQSEYFQRVSSLGFYKNVFADLAGNIKWFDKIDLSNSISSYGFWFYSQNFRLYFLLYFPFLVAVIASIYLIYKKRWSDLVFAWAMWLVPMLSDTTSLNRYLLQSFPFIFAISEICFKHIFTRWMLVLVYLFGFGLTLVLYTHNFWVG